MKLPGFEITASIENSALEIVALLERLPDLASAAKFLHLRKANRIKSIQSSLAIEANSLSLQQVSDIINGKKVLGDKKEIQEVKNAWSAYEQIDKYDPFSLKSFLKAHSLMSHALVKDVGKFRTMQVNVYKGYELLHEGAKPKEIQALMKQLFDWAKFSNVNAIIKSCIMHFVIEYIHPFEDGNGRMGRLWQTVVLNKWNKTFQWLPVETMVYQNQQGYYAALNLAGKQNNVNVFIEFMLGVIKFTIENIIASKAKKIAVINDTINDTTSDTINKQILKLLKLNPQIKAEELARAIDKSIPTVKRRLAFLKKAGLIERIGANKNGYWQVISR